MSAPKHSEDSQPNEQRIGGKGLTRVPAVRPSNGSGRYSLSTGSSGGSYSTYTSSPFASLQAPRHSWDIPSAGIRQYGNHSRKRRRLSDPPLTHSKQSTGLSRPGSRPSAKTKPPHGREIIEIPLPPRCQKGHPGRDQARRDWLQAETRRLETTRSLKVLNHRWMDYALRFECSSVLPENSQNMDFPRGMASYQRLVPPKAHVCGF